jgi:hypothetical protein
VEQRKAANFLWAALSIIALLTCPCARAQELKSNASSVVLVARIPPSVRLNAALLPAPESLLASPQPNPPAAVLLIESQWTFASGQNVWAESRFESPCTQTAAAERPPAARGSAASTQDGESSSVRRPQASGQLAPVGGGLVSFPVFSFLPRALAPSVSLLRDFNPARGPRRQLDSLLVVAPPAADSSVVFLTVTAL